MVPSNVTSRRGSRRIAPILVAAVVAAACSGGGGSSNPYSLDVSPASLSFKAEQYAAAPAAQSLQVSFRGDGLVVGYPPDIAVPGWLTVGETRSDATSATISVGVGSTSLAPGLYSTTLRFITGKADGSQYVLRDVPVRFEVTPPAYAIQGTKSLTVTASANASDLELPLTMKTGLGTADGAACTWQLTSSQPWLTVEPASGNLAADTSLVAHVDAESAWAMPNGWRSVTLTVQLGTGCGGRTPYAPSTLNVTFDLRPAFSASPVSFTVNGSSTAAEFTKTVAVTTNLGSAFASHGGWNASLVSDWATESPATGTGSGSITVELVQAALSSLPGGHHTATLVVDPDDARIPTLSIPVSLDLMLPIVDHVSPATTWVNRESSVIVRGSGFSGAATQPLVVGSGTVTATVVSDTQLRATIPAQATPGRLAVRIDNALIDRGGSELVVLPEPGYAATSLQLAKVFRVMVLDPERQAVLLTDYLADEVLRIRFKDGAWMTESAAIADAVGAGVSVDGKAVLVSTGTLANGSVYGVVELDPEMLATRTINTFSSGYYVYSLVAPLDDGRTMLLNSDQWLMTRWYPGFEFGSHPYVNDAVMRLTRDRSRVLLRSATLDSMVSDKLVTFDSAENAFVTRFKPAAADARNWDVSGDGGRMIDALDVYDHEFAKLGSLVLADGAPTSTAVSPDGTSVYTFSKPSTAWVLRRTDVSAAAGPYPADSTALAFVLPADQYPLATRVSEDGSTLFVLAYSVPPPTYDMVSYFHAVALH